MIPDNVLNKELYKKAKEIADKTYKRHSAYKSMFLVKTYKELGGKYSGKKETKGVSRWNKEAWLQVLPYLENNKKVPCGSGSNKKGCRPTVKVDDKTPSTIDMLVKKHGKKKMIELARAKRKDMNTRINWELGKIY